VCLYCRKCTQASDEKIFDGQTTPRKFKAAFPEGCAVLRRRLSGTPILRVEHILFWNGIRTQEMTNRHSQRRIRGQNQSVRGSFPHFLRGVYIFDTYSQKNVERCESFETMLSSRGDGDGF
jgi:hypothetical protein